MVQLCKIIEGGIVVTENRAEMAFSSFLEESIYDEAEEAIFQLLRKAFLAGWEAAKKERIIVLPDAKCFTEQ